MNGNERRHGRSVGSFLAGIGALVCVLGVAASAWAVATVEISTTDGVPGGTVVLTMSMTREPNDPAFAGAQIDIIVDRAQLGIEAQCSESAMSCDSGLDCEDAEACSLLSCELDPRLPASLQLIANSPRFQNLPGTSNKRLRLGVVGPAVPVTTFEDGTILTCELDIPESATPAVQSLDTDRLVVSDENADIIPSQVVVIPGRIVSEFTPTVTATEAATDTPTETPTNGDIGTPTPTGSGVVTPTQTSMPPTVGTSTHTPTNGIATPTPTGGTMGSPTATPTGGKGGGGGGDGCDCSIAPTAAAPSAIGWFLLLPAILLWRGRKRR